MPIYEYLCRRCGRLTEVMQKVGDRPPSACAECGSKRLAKVVSRTAFQLKGGGWHADLYGSPGKKKGGEEPGKEPARAPGSEATPRPAAPDAGPKKAPGKAGGKKASGKDG